MVFEFVINEAFELTNFSTFLKWIVFLHLNVTTEYIKNWLFYNSKFPHL